MGRGDLQVQDLRVIMYLAQARRPVTTAQIARHFDLPMRTVQRIIAAIEAIPIPLKRDSAGMGGGIRLLGGLSLEVSLPSNLLEMAALKVAREHMREAAGGTLYMPIASVDGYRFAMFQDPAGNPVGLIEPFAPVDPVPVDPVPIDPVPVDPVLPIEPPSPSHA